MWRICAAIVLVVSSTVAAAAPPADKKKQTRFTEPVARAACFKSHGATLDPATKTWRLNWREEPGNWGMGDSLKRCISRLTGIPKDQVTVTVRRSR